MPDANINFSVETLEPRLLLAAFNWTGAAGDTLWNNVNNWLANGQITTVLPTKTDTVNIASGANVVLSDNAAIQSLASSGTLTVNTGVSLTADIVDINNGVVTVNGGWNVTTTNVNANVSGAHGWTRGKIVFNSNVSLDNLNVFGGAYLDGSGNVIVNGTMTWGGALSGTGRLIIAAAATMTIYNDTFATLSLAKIVDNLGAVNWTRDWISSVAGKAVFNNYGTFNVMCDKPYYGYSEFNNFGIFQKTGGTSALNSIYANLYNSGVIIDPQRFIFYQLIDSVPGFQVTATSTPLIYTQGSGQVPVDSNLTITDVYNRTISSAYVIISKGYIAGLDNLEVLQKNPSITDYFDAKSGMLVLISTSQSTSVYDYRQVLQSVQFSTTDTNTATTSRNITFFVSGSNAFGEADRDVEIAQPPVNTEPVWKSASGKYVRDVKEIQRIVGATQTGIYDKETWDKVGIYQEQLIKDGLLKAQKPDNQWGIQTDNAYKLSIALTRINLSAKGIEFLKNWEKVKLMPYSDKNPKQTLTNWDAKATIGYGHKITRQEWETYKNGITQDQAEQILLNDVKERVRMNIALNITATLTQNQIDAIIILAFNIGSTAFNTSSVLKLINDPSAKTEFKDLEAAWKAYIKEDGKVVEGLIKRRNAEWRIYSEGVYEKK